MYAPLRRGCKLREAGGNSGTSAPASPGCGLQRHRRPPTLFKAPGPTYTGRVAVLYVVATPIGNLKDITLRALEVLADVDSVAAEDTRTARKLLSAHGISKQVVRCDAHAEAQSADRIVALLSEGHDVAFASDAGTPGVSDPGRVLVRKVRDAGFDVVPIPGPSAATTLLSVAGNTGKGVLFEGFLSPKSGRRKRRLRELAEHGAPFILFESPYRVLKLLRDMVDVSSEWADGECGFHIVVGREMTKLHEEFLEGAPEEVASILGERSSVRGEFTILVEPRKND